MIHQKYRYTSNQISALCTFALSHANLQIPSLTWGDVRYNLWAESAYRINLKDMFDSYTAILEANGSGTPDSVDLLARFYDAVTELQLMGFISQPRNSRTKDIVTKLTVGGKV